jgi:hypothetical protein
MLPAAGPVTPATLYAQSMAAAHAQRSVHYDSTVALAGRIVRIRADIGRDRGRRMIELHAGATVGRLEERVVGRIAYVRGDAFALRSYLGLDGAQVGRYAGRWFSVHAADPTYPTVGVDATLGSAFDDLRLPAPFRFARAARGLRAIESRYRSGGQPIDSIVTVRAGGRHLPVRQVSRNPAVGTITTSFRDWNERLAVVAPVGALRFRP